MAFGLQDLVGYQRTQLDRAANWRKVALLLQFLVAVPGALSIFVSDSVQLYQLAGTGFVLLIFAVFFDWRYRRARAAGEASRRATLVLDGFDPNLSPQENLALKERMIVSDEAAQKFPGDGYYASTEPPSTTRLCELLEESAFFTRHLQSGSASAMAGLFLLFIVLFAIVGFLNVPTATADQNVTFVRLFLVFLVFLLSSNVMSDVIGHFDAEREAKDVQGRARSAIKDGASVADSLLIMSDYNSAVETSPLIVPFLYKASRNSLNKKWADYRRNLEQAAASNKNG